MYLTDSSGTQFRMKDEDLNLYPYKGDIVIFDLCYEHRGLLIKNNKKLLFGMRIGYID